MLLFESLTNCVHLIIESVLIVNQVLFHWSLNRLLYLDLILEFFQLFAQIEGWLDGIQPLHVLSVLIFDALVLPHPQVMIERLEFDWRFER